METLKNGVGCQSGEWLDGGCPSNGVDFLAGGSAGRAKLLLSRIPAASAAPIPAAPLKRWQSLTAR
ncbi:MAG: hypothetical protein ACKOEO_16725, partial [Planctomycetaceae bacterium]